MTVYLDIIFFENLCMNYIILFTAGLIRKVKIKQVKIILASIIGSFYSIIVYLKVMNIASNIIMKIILSISMVWVAFDAKNHKVLLKDILMFYLVSFVFGGCSFALIYFINPSKVKINNGVLVGLYPIKVTIIAGVVAFIVLQIAFKITKNKLSVQDMICEVVIKFNNKSTRVKTLIDSGNMLKDPVSGYPVMIVEKESIEKVFSKELINSVEKLERGDLLEEFKGDIKLRLIPFSSLGKQNGILVGVKVDSVEINFRDKNKIIDEIIIGVYDKKFTRDNLYSALIGIDVIEVGTDEKEGIF